MKREVGVLVNFLGLLNLIAVIGIIVFGFLGNFSLFFLSSSIAVVTIPWIYDKKNRQGINIKLIETNTLTDKFVNRSIFPLLFIGWLYLLNRFVKLPVIEWYIQLIWGLYVFGLIILFAYEAVKKFRANGTDKTK